MTVDGFSNDTVKLFAKQVIAVFCRKGNIAKNRDRTSTYFTLGLECIGHIYGYQNTFESGTECSLKQSKLDHFNRTK